MPHPRVETTPQPKACSSVAVLSWSAYAAITLALALALAAATAAGAGQAPQPGSHYDRRAGAIAEMAVAVAPTSSQAVAIAALRSALPDLRAEIEPSTGATRSLTNATGYLTEAAATEPFDAATLARDFTLQHRHLLGLDFEDLEGMELVDRVFSQVSGATHLYYRQIHLGIPVYNAQLQIHVNAKGRILGIDNGFLPALRDATPVRSPSVGASDAVGHALRHLGLEARSPRVIDNKVHSPQQRTRLAHQGISTRPIEAELMWLPIRQGDARLVWRFQIGPLSSPSVFDMTVDATSGKVWTRLDWTSQATYRVYPQPVESPMLPTPFLPRDTRVLVLDPDLRAPNASPDGWHRILGSTSTIMRGNNVHAYEDRNQDNAPPAIQANCGVNLVCDFPFSPFDPPQNYTNAAVTNLFYWTNLVHDIQYQYGFDEQAGNFQVANFGRGGLGNDSVRAQAQDGDELNNGFFRTFPDGQSPLLQMHEFTRTNPRRDADLDNLFIVHEYGHGVS